VFGKPRGLRGELAESGIASVFSSDLRRAAETAGILAKRLDAPLTTLYGLRPWKLGSTIEGRVSEEVHPLIMHFFEHAGECPPGGEPFLEFKQRVFGTIAAIGKQSGYGQVAIVTHYRCLKLLEARKTRDQVDARNFVKDGSPTGSIKTFIGGKLRDFFTRSKSTRRLCVRSSFSSPLPSLSFPDSLS